LIYNNLQTDKYYLVRFYCVSYTDFYIFSIKNTARVLRQIIALCIACCISFQASSQTDEEALAVRVLALDTSVAIAKRFCEKMVEFAPGYNLAFIDNEKRHFVRYVYKNEKNESLRVDYGFHLEENEDGKTSKRAVVNYQSISGELSIITNIYNFLFSSSLTPERILASPTMGSPVTFSGKYFEYSLLPDDYEAGYWVLTFRNR